MERAAGSTLLERMADRIRHRGPDGFGIWSDPSAGIYLAHCRLSILDLSSAGHQPMVSASGRFVIAFNGEVYNHGELRRQLSKELGVVEWRGHSDTEVVLAAIEFWGVRAALERFVGMFAFAIWDRRERELILVRDRIGEKPLYWGRFGNTVVFGSELKALQAHSAFRAEINREALTLLLRYSYIPAPYSIFQGVEKLLPGTLLRFRYDQCDPIKEVYWSAKEMAMQGQRELWRGSPGEAVDELEKLLSNAIGMQMEADVPVGTFLSGGIDSSTIVALAQAQSLRPIKTFTIGFNEEGYNEAHHAKAVARHLGTDHTELYVTAQEAQSVIPELAGIYCEPFSDSSQIPTFLVSKLARQHVTVSLSGDAGDELFAGYSRYVLGDQLWRKLRFFPMPLRQALAKAILCLSPAAWNHVLKPALSLITTRFRYPNPGDKLHKVANLLQYSEPAKIYQSLVSHWNDTSAVVVGAKEPSTVMTLANGQPELPEFIDRMAWLDLVSYLPDDILVKVDRAAMAVSLESRIPMLDHRVVEFALRQPLSFKMRDGESKWLLRQVLYRHVPKEIMDRPKMGFGIPLDTWLRGPLREWAEDLLDERRLRNEGYFNPAPIRHKWDEHLSGKRSWHYWLWDVLMFQAWLAKNK